MPSLPLFRDSFPPLVVVASHIVGAKAQLMPDDVHLVEPLRKDTAD